MIDNDRNKVKRILVMFYWIQDNYKSLDPKPKVRVAFPGFSNNGAGKWLNYARSALADPDFVPGLQVVNDMDTAGLKGNSYDIMLREWEAMPDPQNLSAEEIERLFTLISY